MRTSSRPLPTPLRAALLAALLASGNAVADPVPFDSDRWTFDAEESRLEEYLGQPSLMLQGGKAWVEDEPFTDGVIEFDIAFSAARNFVGAVWRLQDGGNYEDFYLRPHQSGQPDANQYTPVFHGVSGWQLYHGPDYAAPIEYRYDVWQHVKIVFAGGQGEVYVDSEEPVLFLRELKREVRPGRVGLSAGGLAPVHFANFRYRKVEYPKLAGSPGEAPAPVPGAITRWQVSSVFERSRVAAKTELTEEDDAGLTWTSLDAEATGITNLARVQGITQEKNTAFAKVTLVSEKAQVKKVRFGYSDAVQVYLNGRLIYGGSNLYRSRDYRYLGTIGLFDELYLPLEEGDNDLRFAVSEAFGGWGILAAVEDRDGLRIE